MTDCAAEATPHHSCHVLDRPPESRSSRARTFSLCGPVLPLRWTLIAQCPFSSWAWVCSRSSAHYCPLRKPRSVLPRQATAERGFVPRKSPKNGTGRAVRPAFQSIRASSGPRSLLPPACQLAGTAASSSRSSGALRRLGARHRETSKRSPTGRATSCGSTRRVRKLVRGSPERRVR